LHGCYGIEAEIFHGLDESPTVRHVSLRAYLFKAEEFTSGNSSAFLFLLEEEMDIQPIFTRSRITSSELTARITEHIQQLAQETDAACVSEEMLRYLEACSRFHHYSLFNLWLILMAKPNATVVAGYHKWQSFNRFVRKGEHGIPILAPIVVSEKGEFSNLEKKVVGFKVVYVFDVSQTEGQPLPPPPNWKSPEKNVLLTEKLIRFAESREIKVSEQELRGEVQGVSMGGVIKVDPGAGTATLIHEIAHELMHRREDRPTSKVVREMEAEAVAFVVARHYGFNDVDSPNYLALYGSDSGAILERLELIRVTAAEVIEAIQNDIDK